VSEAQAGQAGCRRCPLRLAGPARREREAGAGSSPAGFPGCKPTCG